MVADGTGRLTTAYVDTSALLAVVFRDTGSAEVVERLSEFSQLVSSNLLEAEMRTGFARKGLEFDPAVLSGIEWVFPNRSLASEFATVLAAGYLRGADLWHVAVALYVAQKPSEISFLTLDQRQQAVVTTLGFQP